MMRILQDGKRLDGSVCDVFPMIFALVLIPKTASFNPYRETLYQSYPLSDTKKGTWDPVEDLCLGLLVMSSEDLRFRITVHDCDMKSGKHLLIGSAEVKASELTKSPSISIQRGRKVKGVLHFERFEIDWSA